MPMVKEEKWGLLCRVMVQKVNQKTIQVQSYENIRKGRLTNSINGQQLQFSQDEIKAIQILAIYSGDLKWQQALSCYKMPQNIKNKKYVNHLLKKRSTQMEPLKAIEENKKFKVQKVNSIDSKKSQKIDQKVKPLAKVTSKQPLLKLAKQPAKIVQTKNQTEQIITTNRQKRGKMRIESDDEQNKDWFKKKWINDGGKETDTSGKKENEEDKMDIEQPQELVLKTQQIKTQQFQKGVDDDEDEDESLFDKMKKTVVKQTKPDTKLTKAKSQTLAPQPNIKKASQTSIPQVNSLFKYFPKQ